MKNLNQLVLVVVLLVCAQAYRVYLYAAPAGYTVNIVNSTDWQASLGYTTPQNVQTTDTISPNGSKTITSKDLIVHYTLTKGQGTTTAVPSVIPISDVQKGVFQITQTMVPAPAASTVAATAAAHTAPAAQAKSAAPASATSTPPAKS